MTETKHLTLEELPGSSTASSSSHFSGTKPRSLSDDFMTKESIKYIEETFGDTKNMSTSPKTGGFESNNKGSPNSKLKEHRKTIDTTMLHNPAPPRPRGPKKVQNPLYGKRTELEKLKRKLQKKTANKTKEENKTAVVYVDYEEYNPFEVENTDAEEQQNQTVAQESPPPEEAPRSQLLTSSISSTNLLKLMQKLEGEKGEEQQKLEKLKRLVEMQSSASSSSNANNNNNNNTKKEVSFVPRLPPSVANLRGDSTVRPTHRASFSAAVPTRKLAKQNSMKAAIGSVGKSPSLPDLYSR